jgi:2-polyprenyl-3-methyl-5-hydroxy-6-metoxy-1,4-benzoquinol methylase
MNRQEKHWVGRDGDEYHMRNRVEWRNRVGFWNRILSAYEIRSVLDVGCACGWNQNAIAVCGILAPVFERTRRTLGIDINEKALERARLYANDVMYCRAADAATALGNASFDLVVTSGVLIHVSPNDLPETLRSLHDVAQRYVLAIEYASVATEHVQYRGEDDLLWKRPYGSFYEDLGMTLVEQGIAKGFNDCSYWLLRK